MRLEPRGPRGLRVLVHLDEGDPFEVTLEALERARLGAGDALDADARRRLGDADLDVRVREAALDLLARRAHTRRELARKLRRKGFGNARVDDCLARLEAKGLLDDTAVAAAFVRDRLRHRPRGRVRLVSELRAKGVEADVAERAIARVFEDEQASDVALAREAADDWIARQQKAALAALARGERTPERDKARRRLYGYLARRGFAGDAVEDALRHAERAAAERA